MSAMASQIISVFIVCSVVYSGTYKKKHIKAPRHRPLQRFKIIYFLMGPWYPQTMTLMGPGALRMDPTIDDFIRWKF